MLKYTTYDQLILNNLHLNARKALVLLIGSYTQENV